MTRDPDCVFCRIVAEEVPAHVVYEDKSVVSFLDINPLADGHLLVIPREHHALAVAMPPALFTALFLPIPTLGKALIEVTGAQGFNVLLNNGRVAGQVVPHIHCHLIPRKPVDELGYRWNVGKYPPGRDTQVAAAYRKALGRDD